MAKRPSLTEESFLRHLFSPKKNPLPTGIRKRSLKVGAPARGYKASRVASFNRMSPANQELLRRSGWEVNYLKGTGSLKDARAALRPTAVSKGITKPLRTRIQNAVRGTNTDLDSRVAAHIIKTLRDAHKTVDANRIHYHVPYMPEDDKIQASRWNVGQIKAYAGDRSKMITIDDEPANPLWYHYSNQ